MIDVTLAFFLSPAVNKKTARTAHALLDSNGKSVVFRKRTSVASRCQNTQRCILAGDNSTQKRKAFETARMLSKLLSLFRTD
jgi:hypothetical protein